MWTIGVLGVTQLRHGDHPVQPTGAVARRFLAALVAAGSRPATDEDLTEAVWGRNRPEHPASALQVAASRLRRALGEEHRQSLRRTGSGYQLWLPAGSTDADVFTQIVGRARQSAAQGRPGEAVAAFAEASRLWRGEPYADLTVGDGLPVGLQIERSRLVALREATAEEAAAALLQVGDAAGAAGELDALTRAAPYREHRWSLLIQALYQAGRQADALEAARRVRTLLAEDLGVDPGPELLHVEQQIRRQDPRLREVQAIRPVRPRSRFLGRDRERALLEQLIAAERLTTIVGPAGVGKTRLAIEVAAQHDLAWLVRLADVTENRHLHAAVATAVGLPTSTLDHDASVLSAMRAHTGLLLLDNCEHLTAVPRFVDQLLTLGPGIRVLATSRKPLGVDGERTLVLDPLRLPEAVALLEDRIRATIPAWHPQPGDQDTLIALATALDGIPLAIELAAAQVRAFSLKDLNRLLDDHFSVLAAVPDGSLTPHPTLREAIAWSIDLLTPAQRTLVLRLWPYEGGFPLEAADGSHAVLAALVAQSVVTADTTGEVTRYRMLEPIRAHCRSIDASPMTSQAAQAVWARELVERNGVHSGPDAMRVLTRELPNIRAALAHDLVVSPRDAVRTAGLLGPFWWRSGLLNEGRTILTAALESASGVLPEDRLRALAAHGGLEYYAGDGARARELVASAVAGADGCRDTLAYGEARLIQSMAEVPSGDATLAQEAARDAGRLGRLTATPWLEAMGDLVGVAADAMTGRCDVARPLLGATADVALEAGERWSAAFGRMLLAQGMMEEEGSSAQVLDLLRWSLREFWEAGDVFHILAVLQNFSVVLAAAGNTGQATALRDTVQEQRLRHNIQVRGTYGGVTTPDTWYTGAGTDGEALSLEGAIALVA
ncbi:hypothetical protein GCM10022223_34100 [Kineosporia mesophila]|uniref:OmpR/PhoB-type domain-containing protein n=1 Tax=Kineosporia mesophila TaxID=566012 RepID=A0ABP6ZP39_9ACTN|nr:BTAD domain-containing putative transcriptional regulator [Kineosporia mesophila]MCD5354719.1 hypothetical protein [Kineosporia mesophila]